MVCDAQANVEPSRDTASKYKRKKVVRWSFVGLLLFALLCYADCIPLLFLATLYVFVLSPHCVVVLCVVDEEDYY
jgi:hypothetical protein